MRGKFCTTDEGLQICGRGHTMTFKLQEQIIAVQS